MEKLKSFLLFILRQILELSSNLKDLDHNSIVFNSTSNEAFNFNSKYLFGYFVENEPEFDVYFVINNEIKRQELMKKYGDYFINTNTFSGMLIACRSKVWISSVLETPYFILPPFKNGKRFIYHIGHGVPLKKIGLAEERISFLRYINRFLRTRVFTHVLSYSHAYDSIMAEAFKNKNISFVHLGQPRNDQLASVKPEAEEYVYTTYPRLKNAKKLVLYAPTWRNYASTKFFPFEHAKADHLNNILVKNNIFILLREHPFYPSEIDDSYLNQSNILLFNSDRFPEIMDYLSMFDILITDYSSIYLDYLCLDKPVGFIPYDINVYTKITGFNMEYEEITPGRKLANYEDFIDFLLETDDHFSSGRHKVSTLLNAKPSGNCRENAQFIKNLIRCE